MKKILILICSSLFYFNNAVAVTLLDALNQTYKNNIQLNAERENIKVSKEDIKKRVEEAGKVLGISELLGRRPRQLSGGQRQRVAMGRAIVRNPKVFLFDEPLSNLDAKMRGQMRIEIKRVHQHLKTTTIYVTHDQVEAMTLADRVVVMKDGKIEQIGTPDEIYNFPKTGFVAGFIGSPAMNFIPSKIIKNGENFSVYVNENVSFSIDKETFLTLVLPLILKSTFFISKKFLLIIIS